MRSRLRWKILLFTVLLPALFTAGILWTVNRSVSDQIHSGIQERLERSSLVFEHMLASRSRKLGVTAGVIVKDPRFFSILGVPVGPGDGQYRATVRGVAQDFAAIAETDLFEVLDRKGRLLASVGRHSSDERDRAAMVRVALTGRAVSAVFPAATANVKPGSGKGGGASRTKSPRLSGTPHQVRLAPVSSGGRVVGVLVLGAEIGKSVAEELRSLTHSAITFVSAGAGVGTTLEPADERALMAALGNPVADAGTSRSRATVGAEKGAGSEHGRVLEVSASQTYLTLIRRIPRSTSGHHDLYVMQRSLDAETAFLPVIGQHLLWLGMLAAAAALLAGLFLAERITRPVARLVRSAEEMERGNFDYPLQARGRDELAYLTERFNDMRRHERVYVSSLQEVAQMKSDFINVASHELRTPISIIRGYGELFAAGGLGPVSPEQERAFREIEQNLDELSRVAEAATRLADEVGQAPSPGEPQEEDARAERPKLVLVGEPGARSKSHVKELPAGALSDDEDEELRRAA